jgi:predicted Zn-dependent protease
MTCADAASCSTQSDKDAATRFYLQVQRIAGALQKGAEHVYPNLAQRVPRLVSSRFDVYVVDGQEPGTASSANGRIALNAALGDREPYDDWMAFVIAREMGHVIARHHEENSAAGIATSVIMNILIPGSSLLKSLVSAGGSGIAAKSKRDVQALEADAIALNLLEAAGFRLRDIYLTLLIDPVLLDDGMWSRSFRDSSAYLLAEFRRSELEVVAIR